MTATAELERIALRIVPQERATGWRATERGSNPDGSTIYAVVPIIDHRLDGAPVFRGTQRDTYRLMGLLEGRTPTPRRSRDIPAVIVPDEPDRAIAEAPQSLTSAGRTGAGSGPRADASGERTPGGASLRLCAGCDQPLPPGGRSDRRTHDATCRQRAARRAAEEGVPTDADGATTDVTHTRAATEPSASLAGHDLASSALGVDVKQGRAQPEAPVIGTAGASNPTTAIPAGPAREAVQLVLPAPAT